MLDGFSTKNAGTEPGGSRESVAQEKFKCLRWLGAAGCLRRPESLYFGLRLDSMVQILTAPAGHLLILSLTLCGLFFLRRYVLSRFVHLKVHCPTQLAARGLNEAPPRGWKLLFLIIQLTIPRLFIRPTRSSSTESS